MLSWRVGVSALLIPLLILEFVLDHRAGPAGWPLMAFCLLVVLRGCWEFTRLLAVRNLWPTFRATSVASVLVVASGWAGHAFLTEVPVGADGELASDRWIGPAAVAIVYSLCVLALFMRASFRFRQPGSSLENLASEILCVTYIGFLLAITVQLRWVAGAHLGYLVLASVVLATKFGDVSAYFSGRFLGKTKLIPLLSPGKTRVGAAGALIGAGAASFFWFQFATPLWGENLVRPAWWHAVLYGVLLGLVGLLGDLGESLIKRDVEQKDSAKLLPGFGGLLDLIDSILFAGPVAYLFWCVWPLVRISNQ